MGWSAALRARGVLAAAIATGSVGGGVLAAAAPAGAAAPVELYVNAAQGTQITGCSGPGARACRTIQEAVNASAAYVGGTVSIAVARGTYAGGVVLAGTHPAALTITGAGAADTVVTGSHTAQDFRVTAGRTVTISGMAIDTGTATFGGGIFAISSDLTLTDDTFSHDRAITNGGGITSDGGTLVLTHDTFTTDAAHIGGGASVYGATARIADSTFARDTGSETTTGTTGTTGGAGGVAVWGGATASILDTTFSTDSATGAGGGVAIVSTLGPPPTPVAGAPAWHANEPAPSGRSAPQTIGLSAATLTDDTFVDDRATAGGAIFNEGFLAAAPKSVTAARQPQAPFAAATGSFDTLANDTASTGGGVFNLFGTLTLDSSVFDAASCVSSGLFTGVHNVVTATSSGCPSITGVVTTTAAIGLATTLAANTAPNAPQTLALTSTSPAVGEVPATACTVTASGTAVTTDERGFPRQSTATATCDAGAYELQATTTGHHHPGVTVLRTYGPTADATAAQELAASFPSCPGSTGNRPVVLATDQGYPDALSSAYLAADLGTGTLLTPTGSLSVATLAALKAEGITHVYVVGGPLAVSTAVVAALESTPAYDCGGTTPTGSDIVVTRIAGTTAAETAADVAGFPGSGFVGSADLAGAYGKYDPAGGDPSTGPPAPGPIRTAIITSNQEFQDAEGAAVLSYAAHLPILLTTPSALPSATASAIAALGIRQVIVVGGPLAVSTAVAAALEAHGVSVLRVAGTDYSGTSAELAALETGIGNQGFSWDARTPGFAVARGDGYQDGLAGADLTARGTRGSGPVPLLLTGSPTTLGAGLTAFLHQLAAHGVGSPGKPVSFLLALGGPLALSPGLLDAMVGDL